MASPLVAAKKSLWTHLDAVAIGAFGLFLLTAWAIFPVPARQDLTETSGVLASYNIEADQSWFAQHVQRRAGVRVLFRIADRRGRFWSDAVDPGNVRSVFPRQGVAVSFYRSSTKTFRPFNGDGEKTYGLTVDGTQVQSVDDAILHDAVLAHYVLPAFGILALALAAYRWRRR